MSPVSERAAQVRFRRALSLMAMTLVAPGSAQLLAGNPRVGRVAFRTWLGLGALTLVTLLAVLVHPPLGISLGTNTTLLLWLRLGLLLGAVAWAALFVDAWRLGQPLSYGLRERRMAVGVNGLLCFGIAGSMLFGAHIVGVHRDLMLALFGDGPVVGAHDGRYNVLLVGGDSGAGRWGLRTDSMTVASIDAETGKTVLVGLPRNLANFPFAEGSVMAKQFPDGYQDCGLDECMLNGVGTWARDHENLFKGSDDPGMDATVSAIEGVTGLKMNYWAQVNLEGFKDLVDAVGGVELTVRSPIPVGGLGDDVTGYLQPGTRKLTGFETLWYARAREGSDDYSRMARQKCVMSAMLAQANPASVLRHFSDIAAASSAMISTSIPGSQADDFIDLALKAKSQKIASVALVPPMINTADPDIDLVHEKVAQAIDKSEGDAPASSGGKKKQKIDTDVVTGGSVGSLGDGYAANQADDLASAC